jgi:hypothetical protein
MDPCASLQTSFELAALPAAQPVAGPDSRL